RVEYDSIYLNGVETYYTGVSENIIYDKSGERAVQITRQNLTLAATAGGDLTLSNVSYAATVLNVEINYNNEYSDSGKHVLNVVKETYLYPAEGTDINRLKQTAGMTFTLPDGKVLVKTYGTQTINEGFHPNGSALKATDMNFVVGLDGAVTFTDGIQNVNVYDFGNHITQNQLFFKMKGSGNNYSSYMIDVMKIVTTNSVYNVKRQVTDTHTRIYKLVFGTDGIATGEVTGTIFNVNGKTVNWYAGSDGTVNAGSEFYYESGSVTKNSDFNIRGQANKSQVDSYVVEDGKIVYTEGEINNNLEYDINGRVLHSYSAKYKYAINETNLPGIEGFTRFLKKVEETFLTYDINGFVTQKVVDEWNVPGEQIFITEPSVTGYAIPGIDLNIDGTQMMFGRIEINEKLNFRGNALSSTVYNYKWLDGQKAYYNGLTYENTYDIDGNTIRVREEAAFVMDRIMGRNESVDLLVKTFDSLKITTIEKYDAAYENYENVSYEYYDLIEPAEDRSLITDANTFTHRGLEYKRVWGESVSSLNYNARGIPATSFKKTIHVVNNNEVISDYQYTINYFEGAKVKESYVYQFDDEMKANTLTITVNETYDNFGNPNLTDVMEYDIGEDVNGVLDSGETLPEGKKLITLNPALTNPVQLNIPAYAMNINEFVWKGGRTDTVQERNFEDLPLQVWTRNYVVEDGSTREYTGGNYTEYSYDMAGHVYEQKSVEFRMYGIGADYSGTKYEYVYTEVVTKLNTNNARGYSIKTTELHYRGINDDVNLSNVIDGNGHIRIDETLVTLEYGNVSLNSKFSPRGQPTRQTVYNFFKLDSGEVMYSAGYEINTVYNVDGTMAVKSTADFYFGDIINEAGLKENRKLAFFYDEMG
ncbi:MAG: hypothetical protein ACD_79C00195G0001, partial [uncultured bacterium]